MEKTYHPEKSGSFIGRHARRKSEVAISPKTSDVSDASYADTAWRETVEPVDDRDADEISLSIDQFTSTLSSIDRKSSPPDVPNEAVETFSKIIESKIVKYYSADGGNKFGKTEEEDARFLESVLRVFKLTSAFGDFEAGAVKTTSLDRMSVVLQRAMLFLEEEFRGLLEGPTEEDTMKEESDRCTLHEAEPNKGEPEFPGYSAEAVARMGRIAGAMVSAGYETECCQVYSIARRNAFSEALRCTEFNWVTIEEIQRMQWEALEGDISRWISAVKRCSTVLFPGERSLCDIVFSQNRAISIGFFSNLARAIIIQLLNFVDAVVLTRRSAEKLFKYLDMYEALRDLVPSIEDGASEESGGELRSEISAAGDRIGEAAVYIFCDLENSIKGDAAKTPVPGGAIHPLTRYVMNYLKYAGEYKDTLEQIFQTNHVLAGSLSSTTKSDKTHNLDKSTSPFSMQLITVVELLDENLEAKSRLYRDPSLRYIFLMNNGRYINQKIKGSTEILQSVGDTWYRMRSTAVRQYHKNYQRETWGRLLQCIGHDGCQVNGKVYKPVVKEKFKNFNTLFEEIHKTQSTWVVNDDQLQSELRVSISAVVIPAYRSFLGRFRQYLESGKQSEKYIKYQSDDIELMIEGLFDGNPNSMGRRRT
ncbi:exocyst complex component EXO70B1 [Rhododendron vialii]|uniref:exocyst complex component EXO70B1 n=1 Tax=Rhododendron vialii TaxID=182163 RepID=UPI00265E2937|nr:exocyst complex component EXO70B1 [Rhododendron vialii]